MSGSAGADDEPYAVEWTAGALRTLDRLPEKVAFAVIELIYGPLARSPQRVGRRLRFDLAGSWSARRGTYRVMYRIDVDAHTVTITAVAHRSSVYRR